uniref:BHLH domain-containing protein n=1 Tax=Oryza brachyantha TaxID=4533 RepID=J3M0G1_ORYBR
MAPEVFEGVPVACDYLKGMDMDDAGDMGAASAVAAAGAHSLDSNGPHAAIRSIERGIASSPLVYQQLGNDGAVVQVQRCIQPQDQAGASMAAFLQQLIPTSVPDDDHQPGIEIGSVSPDVVCFSGYRSRTPEELMCRDTKEQQITQLARTCSSRGSDPNKKRSAGRVGGNGKKSKSETSLTSSPKPQAPKVNLGEKITALQQIVSPFGKTDTASVLLETINYIKFLHGQIQLFSEPYLTTNSTNKDHSEEKRKAGLEHDLRSRGFCLAPVSWTPELLYHDDVLPECWTPAYRNYFYR